VTGITSSKHLGDLRGAAAKDDDEHDCRWRKALCETIAALGYGNVIEKHRIILKERDLARAEVELLRRELTETQQLLSTALGL
jgi:hypothetical protein